MISLLLAAVLTGQVQVSASSRIESEQSIAAIVTEMVIGYVHDRRVDSAGMDAATLESAKAALRSIGRDGWLPVIRRVASVLGFVVADAKGTVEYSYEFDAGEKHIRRWAEIRNGNVQTTATLTGDFPSPHPKVSIEQAKLTLVANEIGDGNTEIHLDLEVTLDTRFRLRLPQRIAQRKAQEAICQCLAEIEAAGRAAVKAGRSGPEAMISRFVEGQP